ncbi:unnamed protein product [Blepharisma stoltei]|uniref:Calcium-dependent protein kinase n=1 Tax=Blepharisma stoltei TaxID=1481888 RepID=A0AAU9K813_9CILI|nr:unnamed protein product [Blepharisma stoltei]
MGCCEFREETANINQQKSPPKKANTKGKYRKQNHSNLQRKSTSQPESLKIRTKSAGINRAKFIKTVPKAITENFIIIKKLETGLFGDNKLAIDKRNNCQRLIKEIKKSLINPKLEAKGWKEVNKLLELDHPHIAKVYEIVKSQDKIYFIFESLMGGNVFDRIIDGQINEYYASAYISDILGAMKYYHGRGIVHRNIRLENLVFESKSKDAIIKIMDFELPPGVCDLLTSQMDTLHYISPEMIQGKFSRTSSDIWSLGVVLYLMLTGRPPFIGKTSAELAKKIKQGLILSDELFREYSPKVKDLLKKMLEVDCTRRITAADALNHPWILENSKLNKKASRNEEAITQVSKFRAQTVIEKSIFTFIVSQFSDIAEEKEYIEIFKSLDSNNDGIISKAELIDKCKVLALEDIGEVEEILESCDIDGSGDIEYSEFILAATNWNEAAQVEKLRKAFNLYDKSGDGQLSLEELIEAVPGIEPSEWQKFFKEADVNNDGSLSFDEFKKFLLREMKSDPVKFRAK